MFVKRWIVAAVACWAVFCAATGGQLRAEEPEPASSADLAFFEAKVRPVLIQHCYDCHSEEAEVFEGGLALDSRSGLRRGGGRGPAVVPGDPAASLLITAITHADDEFAMPPRQEKLPDAVIADLKKWIERGAADPRVTTAAPPARPDFSAFWAYQRPQSRPAPAVVNGEWPRSEVDHFLLAKLEEAGLGPSPDAPPETLLRRLHFDLVGLPPAPVEREEFLRDIAARGLDAALEQVVDALLASPQFGERWGRHWLDVARFAESSGKDSNISFPFAWRYRDYVIDSVNADIPYDQFLREQLAGDLLPYDSDAERARLLTATGFLAIGPKNLGEMNKLQFLADMIDEQIDAVSLGLMGSSVACARCHDHKFDPFTMQDYYALAGVFASTKTHFGTDVSPSNNIGSDLLLLPEVEDQLILHEGIPAERVEKLTAQKAALLKEMKEGRKAAEQAFQEGRDPNEVFGLGDVLRVIWTVGGIDTQLKKVSATGAPLPLAMGVIEAERIQDVPLLRRGEINKPGELVARGVPAALRRGEPLSIPEDHSGRLELAAWLTDPEHPLTARVYVNRVWKHLFGTGLVRTVDNFGSMGEAPSHPELLDHLAVRLVEDGWSLKNLIRALALSRTYRQASTYDAVAFERDPDNRLLWRMPKKRLEAEAIRDAMLAASGELTLERPAGSLVGRVIGDRPISLIGLDARLPSDLDGATHRSVYLPIIRDRLPDVLELFDFAETSQPAGDRGKTNVPLQALYLMNSPFVQMRAEALAARLLRETDDDCARIERAFAICFNRAPDAAERDRVQSFLQQRGAAESAARTQAWIDCAQALLSTAEFRNLD